MHGREINCSDLQWESRYGALLPPTPCLCPCRVQVPDFGSVWEDGRSLVAVYEVDAEP